MIGIRTSFFFSTLFALSAAMSIPSAVFAYNGWTMQSDQRDINNLVNEGVLNPGQAQVLDNRTVNRQYGGFLNNIFNGGFVGPQTNPMAGMQPSGQIRREDRQLDKLQRDGIISRHQDKNMQKQLWQEHNAMRNGFMPATGFMPTTGFMPAATFMPVANMAPGVLTSVVGAAPVMAPQCAQPLTQSGMCHHVSWLAHHGMLNNVNPYNVNVAPYNSPYYTTATSGTILNRVGNFLH